MNLQEDKREKNDRAEHRQRLRERLLNNEDFEDYELLELMLNNVYPGKDTRIYAKILIDHFGSLRGVLEARLEEFPNVNGFGSAFKNYLLLQREILARCKEEPTRTRKHACTVEDVASIGKERLGNLSIEEIWCAFVDYKQRLISWECMTKGSISTASLMPRDIVERALAIQARGVIVVHNHPGGNSKASTADITFTEGVKNACQSIGIRCLDHLVVTSNSCYSIGKKGFL